MIWYLNIIDYHKSVHARQSEQSLYIIFFCIHWLLKNLLFYLSFTYLVFPGVGAGAEHTQSWWLQLTYTHTHTHTYHSIYLPKNTLTSLETTQVSSANYTFPHFLKQIFAHFVNTPIKKIIITATHSGTGHKNTYTTLMYLLKPPTNIIIPQIISSTQHRLFAAKSRIMANVLIQCVRTLSILYL